MNASASVAVCAMIKRNMQQLHAGYEIMQDNMTMKDKSYEHEEQWMLHGNVSPKGYGNAL